MDLTVFVSLLRVELLALKRVAKGVDIFKVID